MQCHACQKTRAREGGEKNQYNFEIFPYVHSQPWKEGMDFRNLSKSKDLLPKSLIPFMISSFPVKSQRRIDKCGQFRSGEEIGICIFEILHKII